jgi:hypothetical protein
MRAEYSPTREIPAHFWLLMSAPQESRYDSIARKWLALVELRQAHFIELSNTGRWRHYYTKAEFLDEMRKVLNVREQWATIAGAAVDDEDVPPLVEGPSPQPHPLSAGIPDPRWPD